MMRLTLCATLALAAVGCETNLDGGGNDDGAGGAGGAGATTSVTAVGTTGAPSATVGPSATTGVSVGVTGAGGGGACPSAEGLPAAQPLSDAAPHATALGLHGSTIVAATEPLEDEPAVFVRLDAASGALLEREPIDGSIASFLELGGELIGGGRCVEGGSPFVIDAGPTFEPLVDGCPSNPTSALASAGVGLAYEIDDAVWWTSLDGGEPRRLAQFLAVAPNEIHPIVASLAADATHVYAAVNRIEFYPDSSWGEVWSIPLDGGLATRLFESEHLPASGSVFVGGIASVSIDADHVYFPTFASGRVSRVPKAGGPVEVLWDGENQVRDLVRVGTDLVFVDVAEPDFGLPTCTPILRRMPMAGGEAVAVASLPDAVGSVVSDGTSVYLAGANLQEDGTLAGAIYRAPATLP